MMVMETVGELPKLGSFAWTRFNTCIYDEQCEAQNDEYMLESIICPIWVWNNKDIP